MKDIIKGCIAEIGIDIHRVEENNFLPESAKSEKINELRKSAQVFVVDSNPGEDKGTFNVK